MSLTHAARDGTLALHGLAAAAERLAEALKQMPNGPKGTQLDRALVDALKRRQLPEFLDGLKKAQA